MKPSKTIQLVYWQFDKLFLYFYLKDCIEILFIVMIFEISLILFSDR